MVNQDLTFTLLGRDRGASRAVRNVGDAADHVSGRIGSLSAAMLKLGAASALGQAGGGLLAGLPAVAGAGAAAMGTLAMAVKGVGAALSSTEDPEAYAEAMMKLTRSGQQFVIAARGAAGAWTTLRKDMQAETLGPLVGVFDKLTYYYLPMLERDMPGLANDIGNAGKSFADMLTSASSQDAVHKSFGTSRTVVQNLSDMVDGLTSGFLRATGAGGSFAQNLTADLAELGRSFDRNVARTVADGSLARMMDTAGNSLRSFGQALAPVGQAIYNVFSSKGAASAAETFFHVLGSGASVLATVINLFASLPPSVQSTIVVLGAAGMAASKMNTLMQVAGSGLQVTALALESLGSAGSRAGTAVGAASTVIARAAGPIGLAVGVVTALALAFGTTGKSVKRVEVDVGQLTDSMKVFSATGKITGELAKQTGGSFTMLAAKIKAAEAEVARASAQDAFRNRTVGQGLAYKQKYDAEIHAAKGELANVQTSIGAVTRQIADMARGGDVAGAAIAAGQFREAMLGQGKSVEWVNQQLAEFIGISGGATVAHYNIARGAATVTQQQQILNGSWEDAINRVGSLTQAFDILNGRFLTAREAEIAAEDAAHRFGEALKASGGSLDERTEKGREAELALIALSRATDNAVTKAYEQALASKSGADALKDGKKVFDEHRQQLIDQAVAAGMARDKAIALADQYLKMPTSLNTLIGAPGAVQATTEVQALRNQIANLEGKKVQVVEEGAPNAAQEVRRLQDEINKLTGKTVYLETIERRTIAQTRGDQQVYGRAWGGIDLKMGAGGTTSNFMSRWLHSPTILAGERGSEAYISSAAPPERSRKIIREAAEMVGGPETIWPGMGGGGGAGVAQAVSQLAAAVAAMAAKSNHLTISAAGTSPLEQLLLRVLRDAIQARGGIVQSVLGS